MSPPTSASRWLAVAAAALLLPALARADGPEYRVGVIPQAPPVAMYEKWNPLLARLSALTGATLRPKLYENMAAFEEDFLAGGPDLLFAHPAMFAAAHRRQGYVPLVRDRRQLSGGVFVRADSPYHSPSDLQGKRVAFVGERSFCTVLVDRALAEDIGRMELDRSFHGSARNVLRAVLLGKVDAGASLNTAAELEDAETRGLVRHLVTSPSFAPHPIAAHPRVPEALREKVAAAVLEMARNPGDRQLLAAVGMPDPLRADYERDYRTLEPR